MINDFEIMATCFSGLSFFDYSEKQKALNLGTFVGNMGRSNSLDCVSFTQNSMYTSSQTQPLYFESSEHKKTIDSIIGFKTYNDSGLIPPGLVSLGKNILIFENPPTNKLISHHSTDRDSISNDDEPDTYYLPIPWQIYVCLFNDDYCLLDTYMFYSRDAISKMGFGEPVYAPVLPNFFGNGQLCRPFYPNMNDVDKYSKDISGVIASAYDSIWNSGWNLDLYETLNEYFLLFNNNRSIDVDAGPTDSFKKNLNPILQDSLNLFESQQLLSVYIQLNNDTVNRRLTHSRHNLLYSYCSIVKNLTLDQVCMSPFPSPSFAKYSDADSVDRNELHDEYVESCDEDEYSDEGWEAYFQEYKNSLRFCHKSFEQVLTNILQALDGILVKRTIPSLNIAFKEINSQNIYTSLEKDSNGEYIQS